MSDKLPPSAVTSSYHLLDLVHTLLCHATNTFVPCKVLQASLATGSRAPNANHLQVQHGAQQQQQQQPLGLHPNQQREHQDGQKLPLQVSAQPQLEQQQQQQPGAAAQQMPQHTSFAPAVSAGQVQLTPLTLQLTAQDLHLLQSQLSLDPSGPSHQVPLHNLSTSFQLLASVPVQQQAPIQYPGQVQAPTSTMHMVQVVPAAIAATPQLAGRADLPGPFHPLPVTSPGPTASIPIPASGGGVGGAGGMSQGFGTLSFTGGPLELLYTPPSFSVDHTPSVTSHASTILTDFGSVTGQAIGPVSVQHGQFAHAMVGPTGLTGAAQAAAPPQDAAGSGAAVLPAVTVLALPAAAVPAPTESTASAAAVTMPADPLMAPISRLGSINMTRSASLASQASIRTGEIGTCLGCPASKIADYSQEHRFLRLNTLPTASLCV